MTDIEVSLDVPYAGAGTDALSMDLYVPRGLPHPPPVVAFFHGGAWARGDKSGFAQERLMPVARLGVAVASVSYRLSDVAIWPAQLHDAKGAIRWLRAHAAEFGADGSRVGAWGASSGGHLATFLGLTSGVPELEGKTGGNLDQTSSVDSVVAWFPTVDLMELAEHPSDPSVPLPPFIIGRPPEDPAPVARLLGVNDLHEAPDAARAASPINYATRPAPPFLIMHGDRDGLVPDNQSRLLHAALLAAGTQSTLLLVAGANHEDPIFHRPAILAAVAEHLR